MYLKFSPNTYVLRYRNGKVVARGQGLSFFYWERNTSVCAVPVSNQDTDYVFTQVTKDYQAVTIQGQLTYRFTDCEKAASAMDFTVNLKTRNYPDSPLPKVSKRIINLAEVLVKSRINTMELAQALAASHSLAAQVYQDLREDPQLAEMGITVTGFTVLRIAANNDTSRALEAGTRERILRSADDALYERRNASIEQERRIKKNELSTDQMVIERKRELEQTKTKGELERKQLLLDGEIALENKRKELAALRLENAKKEADADAYRIRALTEAYNTLSADVLVALATMDMDPGKLMARAFEKLAAGADKIGTLNITPDLLGSLMGGKK